MQYMKQDIVSIIELSQIITIHYFSFDKNFSYCGESHDFWEIVYADKGNVVVTSQEKELLLRQGEMIFHKPNEFHNLRADKTAASKIFIVSFVCNSEAMRYFENYRVKTPAVVKVLILRIIEEGQKAFYIQDSRPDMREMIKKQSAPIWAQQLIKISIEQLLIELLSREILPTNSGLIQDKKDFRKELTGRIIRYMEQHVDENITVEDVCREVNYGKTYVCTVFGSQTGLTLMQYFYELKLGKAKQLLRETENNTAEISARLSYSNPQYFYRIFKKATGMTAKEYRNRDTI